MPRIVRSQLHWTAWLTAMMAATVFSLGRVSRSAAQENKPDTVVEAADDASADSDDPFGADSDDPFGADSDDPFGADADSDDPFGAVIEDEDKAEPEPAPAKSLSVDECIRELESSDRHARWRAARRLRDLGPRAKQAIPLLAAALKDEDADVASMAAEALGAVGAATEAVVPSLAEALAHPDWVVRWSAAGALARIGPDAGAADKALIRVVNSEKDRDVRDQASRALARIKGKARKLTAE